jgi:ATP-binding cassette, subfamily B, bacterial
LVVAKHTDFTLYRRLLRQARPYWLHIAGMFLLSLLSSPLALLTPLPLKIAVDSIIGSAPLPGFLDAALPGTIDRSDSTMLVIAAGLLVMISLLAQLQDLATSLLRTYTGERMVLGFRAQIFRHIQRLSFTYSDTKGIADSSYRIQYDAPAIQYIAIDGIIPFITATFTISGMIAVTAWMDWQLAMVALVIVPILFLVTKAYRQRLRTKSREVKKLESSALSVVQEVLVAIRVVKAFGQEEREHERFVGRSTEGMRARVHLAFVEGGFGLLVGLITALGTSAVLFIGVRHVQSGVLTLGELLLVMSYLSQLYSPLKTMSKMVASLQAHLAGAERAFALLDEETDVHEHPMARSIARVEGAIAFRNVSFTYNTNRPALREISFAVAAGTRVGIAGRTGAGKSTLMSLLMRFYDPTAGQILLDGIDLREYKLADLRNQFAIVLQETVLFSTSIAENIAYARPGASEAEIVEAAQAANAHEFIVRLPDGYQTLVGERGMQLSGGERQRISLARAFLKNAPILILDEPTSSVDIKTEVVIMEAMDRLMRGRTTFMIAHRLNTLDSCDVRIEIEHGRITSILDHSISPLLRHVEPIARQLG